MRRRLNLLDFLRFGFVGVSVLAGILLLVNPGVRAGTIEVNFAEYLKTLPPDEFASAIVILADQANIPSLNATLKAERATMKKRHQDVLTALRSAASRSQGSLTSYLEAKKNTGSVRGFTPYWIMNLMWR